VGRSQFSRSDFGPLKVHQNRDIRLFFPRHLAEDMDTLLVCLMGAVGEIESRHIHARVDELADDIGGAGGGADGAHNLGLTSHG